MSPRRRSSEPPPKRVIDAVNRVSVSAGGTIHSERVRRQWTLEHLASQASLSKSAVQGIEAGRPAPLGTYARLGDVLGLRLELSLEDEARRPRRSGSLQADSVHSLMGELEAAHLRRFGLPVAMDEPYQHYQFAGRADVICWDLDRRALLHIENRTRFPDLQAAAGSFAAKRVYLPDQLASRLGLKHWNSQAHVLVCLWSAEVLHALRLRTESFRAICPDQPHVFEDWWRGEPPTSGNASSLIVLDPLASGRQRLFIGLDDALRSRPRFASYGETAAAARRLGRL